MANALNLWHPVAAPPVVPYRYGLFSVVAPRNAEVAPNGAIDEHWRAGVVWESQACVAGAVTQGPCIDPGSWPIELVRGACSTPQTAEPFTIYVYNTDSIPGYTLEQHMNQTIERLVNNEQRLVEYATVGNIGTCVAAAGPGYTFDLSAYDPLFALGYVEQWLTLNYGGTGVIWLDRQTTTILWENLRVEGSRLVTTNGTPVISHSGTLVTSPPQTTATIYATGTPVMYRGDIDVREAAIDKAINEVSYVAQRDYVVGWDCVCMAATVRLAPEPV